MRVISITVGLPREVRDRDEVILTGIFKDPVAGPVQITTTGVEGDGQADPDAHGGRCKTVYGYAAEHYPAWQHELGRALPWGQFGENLTIEGLDEASLHAGDELTVGTAVLQVTQPRKPCRKLGLRMGDSGFVKRFWLAGRMGIYFAVSQPGTVALNDGVKVTRVDADAPTIHQIWQLASGNLVDPVLARRALELGCLANEWQRLLRVAIDRQR